MGKGMTDNLTIKCDLCQRPHPVQQTEAVTLEGEITRVWYYRCGGLAFIAAKEEKRAQ